MVQRKREQYDIIFVIIVFVIMSIYFYRLFFETYELDYFEHVTFAHSIKQNFLDLINGDSKNFTVQLSYPGWHIIFYIFYSLFQNDNIANGLTNSLFITLESIVLLWGYRKNGIDIKKSYLYAIIMIFVGPLYLPWINKNYYLGQITANVWHNPTYISVKPFMLLSFFLTIDILNDDGNINKKKFIKLAVVMFISCIFKPSFMQMYGLCLVIFCIVQTILSNGKFFRTAVYFAISCIPTAIIMILQYLIFYTGIFSGGSVGGNGDSNGIGFAPLYVWSVFTDNVFGSLLLSIIFPLYILSLYSKQILKKPMIQLGLSAFISGVGCFACLYNKQGAFCADFAWGAYLAMAGLFLISCLGLEKVKDWKYNIGFCILTLHFICGFIYWINVFISRSYTGGLFDNFIRLMRGN